MDPRGFHYADTDEGCFGIAPGGSDFGLPGATSNTGRYAGEDHRSKECCCRIDRKSTRLNSSHRCTSYAVLCSHKTKTNNNIITSALYGKPFPPNLLFMAHT